MRPKMTALIILDGYGINPKKEGNAVVNANKTNLDKIFTENPTTTIKTSGLDVGLPKGQMGNSEVGHTNIGAGRIVYQELTRITKSIEDGDFFDKEEFKKAIDNCKKNNSKLHIYGLLSDGGVHSHITHLYGLLELAKKEGLDKVYVHCFLDGRDTPPASGKGYVEALENKMQELGVGRIATVSGRFYAMDRDNRWERVVLAYDAMVLGKGYQVESAIAAVEESYKREEYDEFVKPTVVMEDGHPVAKIENNDSIIFYNYRPDRAREITRAFVDEGFSGFDRANGYFKVCYVCMTQYDNTMPNVEVAFKPQVLKNTFGEYISDLGYRQLRIAETEKYAHVTFFFNGGVEKEYKGEDRVLVPSPKVATYDLKPEMSAYEVADKAVDRIKSGKYDVMILNFANPDMVGHTGVFDAAVKAIEAVDVCVKKVVDAIIAEGGVALITADHGNAEQMIDYDTGKPFTSHTTYDVPLALVGMKNVRLTDGRLSDIAPTMLQIMEIDVPQEMTGKSLLA
ncbi:MAG: 2,3-bisphosphoglycerate-independent phosphoglycerate mutase [Clostridiales bacterium]|nr:2,3-bisphosphoglycerate-independent phosphoglycerate mutase [Clostridiales bacterium]